MAKLESIVEIDGREIKLSNLSKVLYPKAGFTKGQVIDYYLRIVPALLPHLQDRPLTLKRYPEGVEGLFFYEKNCPSYRPKWMKTAKVWSEGNQRFMYYCVVDSAASLVWLANLADLELHTSLSRMPHIERPTVIAFDLDPGAPENIVQCCEVAIWIRGVFEVARMVARLLESEHPDSVVSDMKKSLRTGKVFVDWSQNDVHKTTVCVYSLRAKEQPTVSTPLTWKEVESCLKQNDPDLLVFTSDQVLQRVDKSGDLFAPVLTLKQKLPAFAALEKLGAQPENAPVEMPIRKSKRR